MEGPRYRIVDLCLGDEIGGSDSYDDAADLAESLNWDGVIASVYNEETGEETMPWELI